MPFAEMLLEIKIGGKAHEKGNRGYSMRFGNGIPQK